MKAAKDRKEDFYDPARKDNILSRNKTRLVLWEEHLKDIQLLRWTKPCSALKVSVKVGSRPCGSMVAMTGDWVVSDLVLPLWEEVLWPFLDAWDSVHLRTTSTQWNVPGRYGPNGELFFFLLKKEAMVLRELIRFGRIVSFSSL